MAHPHPSRRKRVFRPELPVNLRLALSGRMLACVPATLLAGPPRALTSLRRRGMMHN
jgi:hypothetical protein